MRSSSVSKSNLDKIVDNKNIPFWKTPIGMFLFKDVLNNAKQR